MAEFQEVMRHWGRYCKGYTENHNGDCAGCPFEINGSCNSYAKDNAQHAAQIEKHIMSWAAEHPEPVYPTWEEWLEEVGFVKKTIMKDFIHREYCWKEHISPNIAQKLGIEPKEG